jgi:substrate import-associated zinc metallohydrolase lipoprotein
MKKMHKIKAIIFILVAVVAASCKKDDLTVTTVPVGLGGDTWVASATDKFIADSLTTPYNIAVNYKWLPGQLDFPSDITPPDDAKVVPVLQALLNVCFAPYNQQTGSTDFLKRFLPKTFKLAGSAEYLPNGAIFLGQAEGGTAMLLYLVNSFSRLKKDSANLKQMMHTMHHEMGHILHQNIYYPVAFKTLSTGYTGTWYNISDQTARKNGFITSYAQAAPDEDFVEMISSMLAGGPDGSAKYIEYEAMLAQAGTTTSTAYKTLKAKEAIVVDYFKKTYNIDFYALRAKCRTAFVNYLQ